MTERRTLREEVERASTSIERMFKKHRQITPHWLAWKPDGEMLMLPAPSGDKDTSTAIARAIFEIEKVVRCLFFDEAWRAGGGPDLDEYAKQHGIADHPDRIEIVVIIAEDADAGFLMAYREIVRPEDRRPYLGPLEVMDYPSVEGRLVGMLPRRGAKN